jgi:rapamycin-insensitive companion of mTOR
MWTLRLLINQLYDTSLEVCELAVHYLEEACANAEILREVVEMQPILDHLQEIAHPLMLK